MAEEEIPQESKQKQEECPAGAPAWMTTFSDLVTLLLTFFVLLLSMAHMDEVKFNAASKSLQDAFGTFQTPVHKEFKMPVLPPAPSSRYVPVPQQSAKSLHDKIKARIEALRLAKDIDLIQQDDDTIILRVKDSVLFAPGRAKLQLESHPLLRSIADIIRPLPMDMRIEGHTDNTPFKVTDGNWELSTARAVSVMRYYMQGKMFPLERMAAVGYGQDKPAVPNDSEENKAKNRRVDFLLTLQRPKKKSSGNVPL